MANYIYLGTSLIPNYINLGTSLIPNYINLGTSDNKIWLVCHRWVHGLQSKENGESRRLLLNPEEPRICIFRARGEPQQFF